VSEDPAADLARDLGVQRLLREVREGQENRVASTVYKQYRQLMVLSTPRQGPRGTANRQGCHGELAAVDEFAHEALTDDSQ
jgi:hypothetical protein